MATTTTAATITVTSVSETPSSTSIVGPMKTLPEETTVEDLVMDDCAAAMVLMSFSCSPKSPLVLLNRQTPSDASGANYSTSWISNGDSSVDSGIVVEVGSPPANSFVPLHPKVRLVPSSDGQINGSKKRSKSRIIFACTWPGCDAKYRQNGEIERHVRTVHLGPSVEENEEEFYYTEIEVDEHEFFMMSHRFEHGGHRQLDSPSNSSQESVSEGSSSGMSPVTSPAPYSFSPYAPTLSHLDMARPPHEDPEYQEQLKRQRLSSPIDIPGRMVANNSNSHHYAHNNHISVSNKSGANKGSKYEGRSLLASNVVSVSPKGLRTGRTRGDVRKCRKVYGMEARDSWCTQCRWKKACTRFVD